MNNSRSFPLLPLAGSALLILLTGCATEKALTAQTQPLQVEIARVERELSTSQQATAADLQKGLATLAAQIGVLGRQDSASQAEAQALREQLAGISVQATQANQQLAALRQSQTDDRQRQTQAGTSVEERLARSEKRLNELSNLVMEVMAQVAKDVFMANGKEAFSVRLTGDKVLYPQNDPYIDPLDANLLDELASRLNQLDQEYHLDIQGHTDNFSTDDNNYNLGKARAEVVKRYLHEKKGISISRMSAISYGANKPLDKSSNNNRRIFIRVLVLK